MKEKPPVLEMLELAQAEMARISARQPTHLSSEELADLIWWAFRLRAIEQHGTPARH